MKNKKGGFGAKLLLVLILMIASALGGAYGYRVLDGKLASKDAMKAVENVDVSDYDTAEQTVIQSYIDDAKKDLETAKTRKEVYEVITEFIADVNKVQTKTEKQLEQALREAEEAKQKYNEQQNQSKLFGRSDENTDDQSGVDSQDTSTNSSDGNYKSNGLTESKEDEENSKGFLNSLLGGLSSGADGD